MNIESPRNLAQDGRYSSVTTEKADGVHYTPRHLADFVASQIATCVQVTGRPITILDPSAGDGELILALLRALKLRGINNVEVYGCETSSNALQLAESRIKAEFPDTAIQFTCGSFLEFVLQRYRQDIFSMFQEDPIRFDAVIANPPYVRTQILGAKQAQELSQQFNLAGRIDLYHAFLLAIAEVLKPNGLVGIIVSNRFMTTKSGMHIRRDILGQFNIHEVWDLGDTKIFAAAVLPAILLLSKKSKEVKTSSPQFTSVYTSKSQGTPALCRNVVEGLSLSGLILDKEGNRFFIEHGTLDNGADKTGVWRIKTDVSSEWLAQVKAKTWGKFSDVGKIRVGVKTTADKVFIRSDWDQMPENSRPELLRPLITHHIARRFRSLNLEQGKKILYPHASVNGKRCAVSLNHYPLTAQYLEEHRKTLEARTYVIESGRHWYEIWVPQDPILWDAPKLVFRDISEQPTFWMDLEGSVVNGDCYWLTCLNPSTEDLLWLALAVGNSTFAEHFYDRCFCNKLYAGRRRFCTQYVEHFPLPDPHTDISKEMMRLSKEIYRDPSSRIAHDLEARLDILTWQAFGVSVEEGSR